MVSTRVFGALGPGSNPGRATKTLKNYMITAQEAFLAVRDRKQVNPKITEEGALGMICRLVIEHINRGWLGLTLTNKVDLSLSEIRKVRIYFEDLGYLLDKDTIYWMYNPIIYSRDNDNSQQ